MIRDEKKQGKGVVNKEDMMMGYELQCEREANKRARRRERKKKKTKKI